MDAIEEQQQEKRRKINELNSMAHKAKKKRGEDEEDEANEERENEGPQTRQLLCKLSRIKGGDLEANNRDDRAKGVTGESEKALLYFSYILGMYMFI